MAISSPDIMAISSPDIMAISSPHPQAVPLDMNYLCMAIISEATC